MQAKQSAGNSRRIRQEQINIWLVVAAESIHIGNLIYVKIIQIFQFCFRFFLPKHRWSGKPHVLFGAMFVRTRPQSYCNYSRLWKTKRDSIVKK